MGLEALLDGVKCAQQMSPPRSVKNSLLEFLDQQDQEEHELGSAPGVLPRNAVDSPGDVASLVFKEVKHKMVSLQIRLEDQEKEILLLNEALDCRKRKMTQMAQKLEEETMMKLKEQKDEFEATIQRQLAFSKAVLCEKEELSRRVEELVENLSKMDKDVNAKIRLAKEEEQRRTRKLKESMRVGEKSRRERIVNEMRETIKQDTIKALEPEIQRLIDQIGIEKAKAMTDQEEALRAQNRVHQDVLAQLKQQCDSEHERILEDERKLSADRIQRILLDRELCIEQAKRRVEQERDDERTRMNFERDEQKKAFEDALKRLKRELTEAVNDKEKLYERLIEDCKHKDNHVNELDRVPEHQFPQEQFDQELSRKVNDLRTQMEKERDEQIATVINRLAIESSRDDKESSEKLLTLEHQLASQRQHQQQREKELCDRIDSLQRGESSIIRTKLAREFEAKISEKEWEIEALSDMIKAGKEREVVMTKEINSLRDEKARITIDLTNERSERETEKAALLKEKEDELLRIHERVRSVQAKKDTAILELQARIRAKDHEREVAMKTLKQQQSQLLEEFTGLTRA